MLEDDLPFPERQKAARAPIWHELGLEIAGCSPQSLVKRSSAVQKPIIDGEESHMGHETSETTENLGLD